MNEAGLLGGFFQMDPIAHFEKNILLAVMI